MAAGRPITNKKRSYLVLKQVFKFCRISLNKFTSKSTDVTTRKQSHFNWLKWLLKLRVSIPKVRLNVPRISITVPKIKLTKPKLFYALPKFAFLSQKRKSTKKRLVKKTVIYQRTTLYKASEGWTLAPLLQLIKVPLVKVGLTLSRLKLPRIKIKLPQNKIKLPRRVRLALPKLAVKIHVPKLLSPPRLSKPPHLPRLPKIQLPSSLHWRLRIIVLFVILSVFGAVGYEGYVLVLKDLPSPRMLSQQEQIVTTRILDRNGEVLFRIYEDENRTPVKLADIPGDLINATIAIEDKNFRHHHGFSVKGIARAAIANSKGQEIQQGGSTITQQLVKNRLLSPEKTLKRKLREFVLSVLAEKTYTKDQILEMYFNQVAYGGSTYGVEEAAQRYFGKSVKNLNLAESSLLAGLPAAPSVYSPFGSNPETAKYRQQEVLRRMVEDGYIDQARADEAYNQPLEFRQNTIDIKAPHFVMYVRQLLAEQYGEDIVNQGGLEVRTTLDLPLQENTQNIVTTEVNKLANIRIGNGAALVTNPQTGEILSMVGSKNYFDFAHDGQVNVTIRPRQPGSSIKPLTYATALERGKSPNSIIDDSPITYHIAGSPPYSPQNYDGRFHGKVSVRESLGSSYNVPAVKTLAEIGVETMINKGEAMGIDTWKDRSRFGLSLTLGGGEVLMTDMAEMYSTFANSGYTVPLNPILEVKNYKGETLYRNTCVLDGKGCVQNRTLNPLVAYQISDILKDNNARTPAFGPRSVLVVPNQEVAVKTGTTNNLRDNWTIGYTTDRLVAVWVGNNDNTPMSYVASGVTGASPIWNSIIRSVLDDADPHRFALPDGLIKVKICATSGTLPCQGCPRVTEELFVPGTEPTKQCSPSWFVKKPAESGEDKKRDQILNGATTTQPR